MSNNLLISPLTKNQTILSHTNGIGITLKKQTAKRKLLEQKLEENTEKIKKLKKKKKIVKIFCFLIN